MSAASSAAFGDASSAKPTESSKSAEGPDKLGIGGGGSAGGASAFADPFAPNSPSKLPETPAAGVPHRGGATERAIGEHSGNFKLAAVSSKCLGEPEKKERPTESSKSAGVPVAMVSFGEALLIAGVLFGLPGNGFLSSSVCRLDSVATSGATVRSSPKIVPPRPTESSKSAAVPKMDVTKGWLRVAVAGTEAAAGTVPACSLCDHSVNTAGAACGKGTKAGSAQW